MSNENLYGEGEEVPFDDRYDEPSDQVDVNGRPLPQAPVAPPPRPRSAAPKAPPPQEEVYEEPVEESEDEEAFSVALTDAHLRLEQGNLYRAVMNQNIFEGFDADPEAIQNVQKEIRKFAKERMEIMLGMRKETATIEHLNIDFPFNVLEVEILKKLAHTATKGATEYSDNYVPNVNRTTEEIQTVPKRKTLTPIGGNSYNKTAPAPIVTKKPLPRQPAAPIKRSRQDLLIDQIAKEEGIPRELLEENVPGIGGKPLHEMTAEELIERSRLVSSRRQKQVKSPTALPMATYEQQEMKANQQIGGFSSTTLGQQILEAVKKMPITKQ
jgi:hypothetical protein